MLSTLTLLIDTKRRGNKNGFIPIGAAAMISQHAFSSLIAKDRPDFSDFQALTDFSNKIAGKILNNQELTGITYDRDTPIGPYYTPLRSDHTPARFLKAKPVTEMDKCNNCGICVRKCPMGSISADNVAYVSGICIKCQAFIVYYASEICVPSLMLLTAFLLCSMISFLTGTSFGTAATMGVMGGGGILQPDIINYADESALWRKQCS